MKCSFVPQFIILMALGLGAGFVHSKMAPVKTTLDKPTDVNQIINNGPAKKPSPFHRTPEETTPKDDGKTPPVKPRESDPKTPEEKKPEPVAAPQVPPKTDTPATNPASNPAPAGDGDETLTQALRDKGHISLQEAHALFAADTAYFVDTRKKADYEAGHIKNALGIPLATFHGKTPKLVDGIDRSSPVVVYCIGGTCDESEEVAKNFNLMGYKNVYILHAGFPGWQKAGYPVETGAGIQEEE